MKRILFNLLLILVLDIGFAMQSNAALTVRATDASGYKLIYDSDRNITWYDYRQSPDIWANQVSWADKLTVTVGSTVYDDWRLPTVPLNPHVGYYNPDDWKTHDNEMSEMEHLYYTEFHYPGPDISTNSDKKDYGVFDNLEWKGEQWLSQRYWSGVEYDDNNPNVANNAAEYFNFGTGYQNILLKTNSFYAIAVRDGDISVPVVTPEPTSMILFGLGGVAMAFARRKIKV